MAISKVSALGSYQYITISSGATSADANDANDVIFDKTLIPLVGFKPNQAFILNDIVYVDPAAQAAAALTWWFFDTNITTFGTADAAPSISDGDAATCLARIPMAATDQTALANNTIGSKNNIGAIIRTTSTATGLYVALTSAGTPNHAGATLTCRFGFIL